MEIHIGDRVADVTLVSKEGNKAVSYTHLLGLVSYDSKNSGLNN